MRFGPLTQLSWHSPRTRSHDGAGRSLISTSRACRVSRGRSRVARFSTGGPTPLTITPARRSGFLPMCIPRKRLWVRSWSVPFRIHPWRSLRGFRANGDYHPSEPHWYLPMIEDRESGERLRRCAPDALQQCDLDHAGGHTWSPRTPEHSLYQRHGFEVLGTIWGRRHPLVPMLTATLRSGLLWFSARSHRFQPPDRAEYDKIIG
jgi:hypothetical protein